MSRMALPLLLLLTPTPTVAQTADQALATTRRLTGIDADGCPAARDPDEILVCGSRPDDRAQRLPYPAERGPRDAPRHATGEIAAASSAPIRTGHCGAIRGEVCFGGVGLVSAGKGGDGIDADAPLALKLLARALDPAFEISPPKAIPEPR